MDGVCGTLRSFIIEPFLPHPQGTEHYVCIQSSREGDSLLFYNEGGIDIGDVDSKATHLFLPIDSNPETLKKDLECILLLSVVEEKKRKVLVEFIYRLYAVYVDLSFTYLEINPIVVLPVEFGSHASFQVTCLDLAAKLDQTAEFLSGKYWKSALGHSIEFPAPFGRDLTREEIYIADLDSKTGSSLKLTLLNASGRIWTMVAGGGASVVYR